MLYKVLAFVSLDKVLKCDHHQMKATEQYFPMVLFTSAVQGYSKFSLCAWTNSLRATLQTKATEKNFQAYGAVFTLRPVYTSKEAERLE